MDINRRFIRIVDSDTVNPISLFIMTSAAKPFANFRVAIGSSANQL